MKRGEGVFCDKCQNAITPDEEKRGEALHYHKVDYHTSCYVAFLRQHGAIKKEVA